jgi:MFS superfamily sulfate permease-like transporter
LFGVLEGIVAAVALSVALFFQRNWWPHGEVLGLLDGENEWHSVRTNPTATPRPGLLVYRWEAPLFFANASIFRQQVRHLVRKNRPAWVILQCEAITDIDVSAADMLERLDVELNEEGVHVAFVELRTRLRRLLDRYGLLGTLDRDHFYDSIDEALAAIDGDTATAGE